MILLFLALQLPPPARLPFEAPEPPAKASPSTLVYSRSHVRSRSTKRRTATPARNSIDKGFHYR